MKYKLSSIGLCHANEKIYVSLLGGDDSQQHFYINISGMDVPDLTIKEIEVMAIRHAQENFNNCDC